ncbi:hypothetical protein GCK32_003657 [Trichostrongylus colubriformis]|uniref:J domain-containing protein n=1 Tax=Trichostrongylus colubriformis TaxID=6319 RepID=A0AAN8FUP4_TRICO
MRLCVPLCALLIVIVFGSDYPRDPYATLGISRRATAKEIKRAYKQLAREWHPDKNTSPEAQERFVAISRAYELLSDPLRKERFDKFGAVDETPQSGPQHHGYGGFEQFFGGFGGYEDGIFGKQRISLRQYTHTILERSHYQPFLLYAYSNYCQLCFRLQAQWKSVSEDLEPLGYGIGAVNAMTDGNLQSEWIKPFLEQRAGDSVAHARDVLVIWRIEHVKARFTWLESAWGVGAEHFETLLGGVISQSTRLDLTASVGNLINEYAPSWWTRMCRALVRMVQSAWFHITKEEAYPVLSAVATFLVILIIGYSLNYMNQETRPRKEKPRSYANDEWHPEDPQSKSDLPQKPNPQAKLQRALSIMNPHIHELRAESYFGMIRLLKPGCRSLILLVDEQSKEKLLMQFAQYILPLRNNKTFSFGFLMVEKNLPWFRKLLEHTLPLGDECTPSDGNSLYVKLRSINPRQTVGTVLALCGWKLYFSIYHPMHTAGKKKQQNQHFLGFDDSDDVTSDSDSDNGTAEDEAMLRRTGFWKAQSGGITSQNGQIISDNVL